VCLAGVAMRRLRRLDAHSRANDAGVGGHSSEPRVRAKGRSHLAASNACASHAGVKKCVLADHGRRAGPGLSPAESAETNCDPRGRGLKGCARVRAGAAMDFYPSSAGRPRWLLATGRRASRPRLLAAAGLLLEEFVEFLVLDREAIGVAFLIGGA